MNRPIGITAIVAVACVALAAGAQQPPVPRPGQPPPVFRAGTDVVQVDAVVHDKAGRFIADLQPSDFQVTEDGVPQKIEQFYVVGGSEPAASSAASAPATPRRTAPPATPAVRFPHAPRMFVAVFDDDHLTPGGFKRVRDAAVSLFSKQFRPGDIGGVLVGGRMANNRLTSDREALLKAVHDAKPSGASRSKLFDERDWPRMDGVEAVRIRVDNDQTVFSSVLNRACRERPDECSGPVDIRPVITEKATRLAAEANVSTQTTLRTLDGLMNGLSKFDGRKSLLLLTEGFIAQESWGMVQQVIGLAARANATVYTLDARGLDRMGMSDALTSAVTVDAQEQLLKQFDRGADSVNSLAVDTGGFVIRNTNIFDQAVARIADDASHYYVLGYRPEKAPDGKFRKVSVKVTREDLTVRARKGYVATARPVATEAGGAGGAAPAAAPAAAAASPADVPASPASPARPGPLPASPALPASGTVVPNAASGSGPELHLRPNAAENVETLSANARDPDADKGWRAYQRGDLESARASLAVAAARPFARPWIHYALGQSDYALGRYQDAVAEWEMVRERAPEFQPVYFDLVDGYLQLRDPDQAARALHAAEERWPKDAEIYEALGVVQTTRGALNDAVKSFQKAVALAPDESVGYFNLAKTFELRYVRTRRFIEKTATWLSNKGDRDSAIRYYEKYLEMGGPFENSAREGLARLNWTVEK